MTVKWTYFQYFPELDLPIYIRCDLSEFTADFLGLLPRHNFEQIQDSDVEKIDFNNTKMKVLTFREASPRVAMEIGLNDETDQYGLERITPRVGYKIYRYKGHALVVYSENSKSWEIGCFSNFGNIEDRQHHDVIMNRYLSWCFSSLGIVGVWGVPVEEGVVVLNKSLSKGEAVYFDVKNSRVITFDGIKKIKSNFNIIRLDSSLKREKQTLKKEELFGLLMNSCTYMDFEGLSVPVRQAIHTVSKSYAALVIPSSSFRARAAENTAN